MTRAGLTRTRRKKLTLSLLPEDLVALELEAEFVRQARPRWRQGYRVSSSECARIVLLEALRVRAAIRADARLAPASSPAPAPAPSKKKLRPSDDPDKVGRRA